MVDEVKQRVGRTIFVLSSLIAALVVLLLPIFVNKFLYEMISGAEGSGPRMMLRAIILPLGALIVCIPLLIVTRRRLRDLDLGWQFLFFFPILPLLSLAGGPVTAVFLYPFGGGLLFGRIGLVIGAIAFAGLSIAPSKYPSETPIGSRPRSFIGRLATVGAVLALAATYIYHIQNPYETVRYRMTVSVDTPEGIRTGSAVRQMNLEQGQKGSGWVVGEAVVVDLGSRGTLFALMDGSNIGWGISYAASADFRGLRDKNTPIGTKWTMTPREYPVLVAFKDINDPKTLRSLLEIKNNGPRYGRDYIIASDHFEELFGSGIKLKEITVERTNDPITTGIEKYLPWIHCAARPRDPGNRFTRYETYGNIDMGTFKTEPREFYLKKMRASGKPPERPECAAFWQKWDARDDMIFKQTLEELRPLAEQGNPEAEFKVGHIYSQGEGVPTNPEIAVSWYRKAADQGYSKAQNALAAMYSSGRGVTQDYAEALYWTLLTRKTGGSSGMSPDKIIKVHQLTPEQVEAVNKRVNEWVPTAVTPKQ